MQDDQLASRGLSLDPPIPAGIFATGSAHPCVAACAPVLAHLRGALRSGARGALRWARPSANLLHAAGGSRLSFRKSRPQPSLLTQRRILVWAFNTASTRF